MLLNLISHSAKYWLHVCQSDVNSFVRKAYIDSYNTCNDKTWVSHIKSIWTKFNIAEVWNNQGTKYKNKIIKLLKTNIQGQYDQCWYTHLNLTDSKLRTYKLFKNIELENYLLYTKNVYDRKEFTKLRISSHQLQIEIGRYTRPRKTPVEQRTCILCNCNTLEDEEHFVLDCPFYAKEREILFTKLDSFTSFKSLTHKDQFLFVMSYNNGDIEILQHILDYINIATQSRKLTITTGNTSV